MKKVLAIFLAVLMLTALAAGCNKDNGGSSSGSKVLRIGSESDITTLYGCDVQGVMGYSILKNMLYDPLVRVDDRNGELVMCLAESFEYSDDETTLTFKLRDGAKFHNGNAFTADDVVFSFAEYCEHSAVGGLTGVAAVRAVDDKTVAFDLEFVYAPLLTTEMSDFLIMDKEYYDQVGADEYAEKPIGTGPYEFVSWEKANNVKVKAYDGYWSNKAPIEEVEVIFMVDATARANAIEVGDVDITTIASSSVELLEGKDSIVIMDSPMCSVCGPVFNLDNEYFSDVRVRKAIAYAIDRDFMVETAHPGGKGGVANSIWISEYAFGYSDKIGPKYNYDVAKAKELLAEAGYADGFDAGEIICNAGGATAAEVLMAQLSDIGIKSEIRVLETAALYEAAGNRNFGIAFLRIGYGGADVAASDMYWKTGGGSNYAGYSNPRVDELYDEGAKETDPDKRIEIYTELGNILQEDMPWAQCYAMSFLVACNSDLQGLHFNMNYGWQVYDFSWK
ncbi:MAG: ABC transporter substrate-binding protein [Clostridia bacterium]|nr:ABC transporter substrate-binding protein [Clostridia bacterium]